MNISNIFKKYNFYKLLHPLTLVVTFPIVYTTLCFLTKSLLEGFIIYVCILINLILVLFLNMLRETESREKETTPHNVITLNFSEEVAGKTRDSFKDNLAINA